MSILFVRHGQAASNINLEQGVVGSDAPLTQEGIEQVRATGNFLLGQRALELCVETIYHSPYRRTRETAEIIAEVLGFEPEEDVRLQEIQKGTWHGKPVLEVIELENNIPEDEKPFHREHGGENWPMVGERVAFFARDALARHGSDHVISVSHNHPILCGIGRLMGTPVRTWEDRGVSNASITSVCRQSDGTWTTNEACYDLRPHRSVA